MSTTTGGAIVIVVIVIVALGVFFAETSTSPTSTTSSSSSSSVPPTSSSSTTTTSQSSSTSGSASSSSSSATVTIPQGAGGAQELNFSPASITVAPGTTVTFTDQDNSAIHNVYFTSLPSGATLSTNPSPNLTQGSTYQVTLTVPGTYDYECQYHSAWMQGTITVS